LFLFVSGQKVISRSLTTESIREITEVLRRPPVIWDNLHANDYDQKRVFLGPYQGRSPDLISQLRGVLTNPNCEYGANFVAIHTLAQWSKCTSDPPTITHDSEYKCSYQFSLILRQLIKIIVKYIEF
jgi:protein O-GlcNAcase/histone acetyltransferase